MGKKNKRFEYGKTDILWALRQIGLEPVREMHDGIRQWKVNGLYYKSLQTVATVYLSPKKRAPQKPPKGIVIQKSDPATENTKKEKTNA